MDIFLYYVLPFILVLGVLIFFHELGHFIVAKYFHVKVLKFSLGFGNKLVGKKIGETEYLISSVPLGGYVKLLGESGEDTEEIAPEDEARSFSNQHVLKRIAIVLAGPVFNLLLALVIFSLFYLIAGYQVMTPQIGQVRENSPASKAGIQKGDVILAISGQAITSWEDIKVVVRKSPGIPLEMLVKRGDKTLALTVVPEVSSTKNIFGEEIKTPLIGVVAAGTFKTIDLGPGGAIKEGFKKTWDVTKLTCLTIVKLFERVVPIKTLGGPILIGQMTGQLAKENFAYLFPFMAVISVNLGILNLLPVPILDGGLIIFLLVELILGRPISIKKRDLAQKVGLILLIMLMMVVMYNDITRIFK
ncbi:MAG: RIP metalloprotease RseP [Deltaproteobacteria bacterium]|nr:RIP metalloprotease RseP [Deltaproteobacteria bacterium]MBW1929575.1 RIP metalloprotease RseP [Deltaproteobacteria bacterium]MBW2025086.1 RIP metalloprotease RseP [Deltaproteobacteria bacterium]MBW2124996.1 RIP metalloprotease RseP [Deltaproteobacteria bacterium]RLB23383.1 MAG: RIP metalloprotease RseP [Deltaproteobacteria bacterium]